MAWDADTNEWKKGYDGASVISGKHSGVTARIKEMAKFAFYLHCSTHCLNLVFVDTVKSVPQDYNFFLLFFSSCMFSKFLSEIFQSPYVNLVRAVDLVDLLLETLQHDRDEGAFEEL